MRGNHRRPGLRGRCLWPSLVAISLVVMVGRSGIAQEDCTFVRGDVNFLDGLNVVDLNDAVEILAFLYLGVSAPECTDAADVNDNGIIEPGDYTYLVNFLFDDGPPPPLPYPDPGVDPTPEVTVSEERDERFTFDIESVMGVPSFTGLEIPVTLSNQDPISGLQMVFHYNRRDESCPELLIQEIRTEEGTLLSEESSEYIIAEFDNVRGIAYIAALKDFSTPFWFHVGGDPNLPAGDDQLVGTLVLAIAACAEYGDSPIYFADGESLRGIEFSPEAHNLVVLGDHVVRPVLGAEGVVTIAVGFIRGDGNRDGHVDIGDPVYLLGHIFRGDPAPPCMDGGDANNDTRIDISDPIFLLNYLFTGGPQPSEPFPQAGVDPSDDGSQSLGCDVDR